MAINLNTSDNNKKPKIPEKIKNAVIYGVLIAIIAGVFVIRPMLQDVKDRQPERVCSFRLFLLDNFCQAKYTTYVS